MYTTIQTFFVFVLFQKKKFVCVWGGGGVDQQVDVVSVLNEQLWPNHLSKQTH